MYNTTSLQVRAYFLSLIEMAAIIMNKFFIVLEFFRFLICQFRLQRYEKFVFGVSFLLSLVLYFLFELKFFEMCVGILVHIQYILFVCVMI